MERKKHFTKVAAAVALAACLFALGGCAAGGGADSKSDSSTPGGLWTIVSLTKYDVAGNWAEGLVQEYDEVGHLLSSDWTYADGTRRVYTYGEFDDFGASITGTRVDYDANGGIKRTVELSSVRTYDEAGRLIQVVDESDITFWYAYHDNGVLAESTTSQGYVHRYDDHGRKIFYDGGFLSRDGRGAATATYMEDARGNVTGWTITFANGDSYDFTCTMDKHGNITDVYGPNGQLLIHAEYQHISKPCPAAEFYSSTRAGTWLVMDAAEQWLGV